MGGLKEKQFESGDCNISVPNVERIGTALGITIDELLAEPASRPAMRPKVVIGHVNGNHSTRIEATILARLRPVECQSW
jgi:hypothetical protein